jgi:16S rRNA (uracil1498-N3)-methyltransferase
MASAYNERLEGALPSIGLPGCATMATVIWVFLPPARVRGGEVLIDGSKGRHLARVRRVRPGETGVAISEGQEHRFTVSGVHGDRVSGVVTEIRPVSGEQALPVTLLQALLPHADFEAVLEAGTAVGITRFIPVVADRAVGRAGADRLPRWHGIVESAAEQSQRTAIPSVAAPQPLGAALQMVAGASVFVLDPAADLRLHPPAPIRPIALAVGPEGGWTPAEIEAMVRVGGMRVTLGPRVLRARLAGVIAAAILIHACG